MMEEFDNELRTIQEKYQQLADRIESMNEQQQSRGEAVPRLLPEDVPAATSQATFEVLGKEGESVFSTGSAYTTHVEPRVSSIFGGVPRPAAGGKIFKLSEPGPLPGENIQTPPSSTITEYGQEIREQLARIEGDSEGLVAPPPTPTTSFIPIVQQPSIITGTPTKVPVSVPGETSAYSETLKIQPEIQVPLKTSLPKTYLIPWHMSDDPGPLQNCLHWLLQTVHQHGDLIKILISGEVEGGVTMEGYIDMLITDMSYLKDKEQLRQIYPTLVQIIEQSGLEAEASKGSCQFQIEIRRKESLSWSLRSEFQWPHVEEQLIVVAVSHLNEPPGKRPYEEFILKAAPCQVIDYKI